MFSERPLVQAAAGLGLGASVFALAPHGTSVGVASATAVEIGPSHDDDAMKKHAVDVASYTMHAVLDPATHVVHGNGTIVWRNTANVSTRELWVHLYLNAFKNERTLFMRAPVGSGGRGGGAPADWGQIEVRKLAARELHDVDLWPLADQTSPADPEDETDIRIPLPRDVAPGETLTLDAVWDAKLPSIVLRTGYAKDFFMVAQWFPKLARLEADGTWRHFPFHHLSEFYADFGTYEVTIDVPSGMVVGATGKRSSQTSKNGRDLFVYRQDDVHDFAWTAWPAFHEKTAVTDGIDVRILYPAGYDTVAARELDIVAFGLRYFGAHYGRYPYPALTIVHPPSFADEAAGMEYPTLMTSGGAWYAAPFSHDVEALVLHELGHQYFYGLIATDEYRFPFLDEGITSFAESDALSARFGAGANFDFLGYEVDARARLRSGASGASHTEPIAQPARDFASGGSYAALVYTRSAAILDTLARVYGHEQLLGALSRYARRYRFEHPTLPDFIGAIREGVGESAAKNLEVALLDQGWVDYLVTEATSKRGGPSDGTDPQKTTAESQAPEVWQGWALVMRHGTLKFPVDVELWGADGSKQMAHWDGVEAWTRIPYRGQSELSRVMVDPAVTVTLDANLLNNGFRLQAEASPHRTLERLTYFAELGLFGLMP